MTTKEVVKASILTVIITLIFIFLLKDITVFALDTIVDSSVNLVLNTVDNTNILVLLISIVSMISLFFFFFALVSSALLIAVKK